MMLELFKDTFLLLSLGALGWFLFQLFRLPVAALLGSLALVGLLRALEFPFPLPTTPDFLSPLIQIILGVFIGSKITRETVRGIKSIFAPALIIIFWTLSVAFLLGLFFARITHLDPITSILSSTMGGLPEMTIIALATDADLPVVIVMKTFRMVVTIAVFPVILKWRFNRLSQKGMEAAPEDSSPPSRLKNEARKTIGERLFALRNAAPWSGGLIPVTKPFLVLGIASLGGFILASVGIPAGFMVGSLFFTAGASLAGLGIKTFSPAMFNLLLVALGVMVADNMTQEAVSVLASGKIVAAVLITTFIIFLSSFLTAFIIHKAVGWDYSTCFLAAAPAGLTVMAALAIKFGKDPFPISMLHLSRLIAIKIVVPLVFFLFIL